MDSQRVGRPSHSVSTQAARAQGANLPCEIERILKPLKSTLYMSYLYRLTRIIAQYHLLFILKNNASNMRNLSLL